MGAFWAFEPLRAWPSWPNGWASAPPEPALAFARNVHPIRTVSAERPPDSNGGMSMALRQTGIAVVLLSGAALMTATNGPSRAADELRIGFIAPMTGILAQVGKDMADGTNMYLEEAKGDFGGAKVKLIVEDSTGRPDTAVTKAKKLNLPFSTSSIIIAVL
jgi:ABC-type branched-subunit amino acid transport system substrate-binding protein